MSANVKSESTWQAKAEKQHGLITRDQALELGMTNGVIRAQIAKKSWKAVYRGVYQVTGMPKSFLQRLHAAWLWAGEQAVVSHHAAGILHRFERIAGRPSTLDFTLIGHTHAPKSIRLHRVRLDPRDTEKKGELPVTTAARTLLDLCTTLEFADVRACVHDALRRQLTTLESVDSLILRSARIEGIRTYRTIIDPLLGGDAPTQSELESKVFDLIERAGLPAPICQNALLTLNLKVRKLDFWIPGTNIAIEADGYAYHASIDDFEEERARANELAVANMIVFHWTRRAIQERPDELVAQLKTAVASRQPAEKL